MPMMWTRMMLTTIDWAVCGANPDRSTGGRYSRSSSRPSTIAVAITIPLIRLKSRSGGLWNIQKISS